MKNKFLVGLVVVMTVLGLAACGSDPKTVVNKSDDSVINQTEESQTDTLETLMATEMAAINEELKETQESQAEVYEEILFKVEGNSCIYVYSCVEGVSLDSSMLETLVDSTFKPVSKSLFDALYGEYEIYPDSVSFNFVSDGGATEIYTYTYTKADYDAEQ